MKWVYKNNGENSGFKQPEVVLIKKQKRTMNDREVYLCLKISSKKLLQYKGNKCKCEAHGSEPLSALFIKNSHRDIKWINAQTSLDLKEFDQKLTKVSHKWHVNKCPIILVSKK